MMCHAFIFSPEIGVFVQSRETSLHDQFWVTVMGVQSYIFRVQAASDVYVALCSVPRQYETLAYEVRIGVDTNSRTQIVKTDGRIEEVATQDILSPSSFLDMWVAWGEGSIQIGRAHV